MRQITLIALLAALQNLIAPDAWAESSTAAGLRPADRPWTVADNVAIQRVPTWFDGVGESAPFKYTPDGKWVAFIVLQPQVDTAVTVATLRVYEVRLLQAYAADPSRPVPNAALEFSRSSSGLRPGISHATWSADGHTLGFIGEGEHGTNALYLWTLGERAPSLIVSSQLQEPITDFHYLGSAERVALLSVIPPRAPSGMPELVNGRTLVDALGIDQSSYYYTQPHRLRVWDGHSNELRSFDVTVDGLNGVWPSPDGNYVAATEPFSVEWSGSCWKAVGGVDPAAYPTVDRAKSRYFIADVRSGKIVRPTGGPTGYTTGHAMTVAGSLTWSTGIYWSKDSSLAVAPFSLSAADECGRNPSHAMAATYAFAPDGSDRHRLVGYDDLSSQKAPLVMGVTLDIADDGSSITLAPRQAFSEAPLPGARSVAFERSRTGWRPSKVPRAAPTSAVADEHAETRLLSVREDYNEPPAIVVTSEAGDSRVLYDLAPHARGRTFTHIEEVTWQDSRGNTWRGLLSYPRGYSSAQRWPLLVQTHDYRAHAFYTTGSSTTTVFPGRAASDRGFMVLTVTEHRFSSEAGGANMEAEITGVLDGYRAAVNELNRRGLIDPSRVGVIGWSRTGWYALNAVTFAPELFKAAVIADNVDYSYLQMLKSVDAGDFAAAITRDEQQFYGGRPWGNWQAWLSHNPIFNADHIKAAVRFESDSQRGTILDEWEAYASLRLQNVPTELWVYPQGMHALVRPIDQQTSEEGSLDWLDYWINGGRSADARAAGQYERWDRMRSAR